MYNLGAIEGVFAVFLLFYNFSYIQRHSGFITLGFFFPLPQRAIFVISAQLLFRYTDIRYTGIRIPYFGIAFAH